MYHLFRESRSWADRVLDNEATPSGTGGPGLAAAFGRLSGRLGAFRTPRRGFGPKSHKRKRMPADCAACRPWSGGEPASIAGEDRKRSHLSSDVLAHWLGLAGRYIEAEALTNANHATTQMDRKPWTRRRFWELPQTMVQPDSYPSGFGSDLARAA